MNHYWAQRQMLFQLGRAGRKSSASARSQFLALASATALVTLAFLVLAASYTTYQQRVLRDAARTPTPTENTADAPLRWELGLDELEDAQQFSMLLLQPQSSDVPLPPGLPRWPTAGEVFLSPELLRAGRSEGIETRYGRLAGVIEPAGLSVPDERFAYINPSVPLGKNAGSASGFGVPPASPWSTETTFSIGETLFIFSLPVFLLAPLALLLFPAGALLYGALGVGLDGRRRSDALLGTLGARPSHRRWVRLGACAAPVAGGLTCALGFWSLIMVFNIRLPITGFIVPTQLWRDNPRWLVFGAVLALVMVLAVATIPRPRPQNSTRPQVNYRKLPGFLVLTFPLAIFLAVRLPDIIDPGRMGAWTAINLGGTIVTLIAAPVSLAILLTYSGRGLAAIGRRLAVPALVVGGGSLNSAPQAVLRMMSTIVIGICLIIQAALALASADSVVLESLKAQSVLAGQVALLPDPPRKERADFLAALPSDVEAALITTPEDGRESLAVGSCPALRKMDLPCNESLLFAAATTRAQALWSQTTAAGKLRTQSMTDLRQAPPSDGKLVLYSNRPGGISQIPLKEIAYRTISGAPQVSLPGAQWIGDIKSSIQQSKWVLLFGFAGMIMIALSLAINSSAQFRRQCVMWAPITALSGRRWLFHQIGACTVLLPMVLASWASAPISLILSQTSQNKALGLEADPLLLVGLPSAVTGIAVITWLLISRTARSSLRNWRPGLHL